MKIVCPDPIQIVSVTGSSIWNRIQNNKHEQDASFEGFGLDAQKPKTGKHIAIYVYPQKNIILKNKHKQFKCLCTPSISKFIQTQQFHHKYTSKSPP